MMKVAIIGGGFCGASLAKKLDKEKDISVALIDKNPFFEYNPSAIKCITRPGYQQNIRKNFTDFLSNTVIINESVYQVTPSLILTENKKVHFDNAVLCTGSYYPIYLNATENVFSINRSKEAKQFRNQLGQKAKRILIVGGGYVGTEIAAELAFKRKDLDVLMVHAHDRLLERGPIAASKYARKVLENNGVKILFNDKIIDHPSEKRYQSKMGNEIEADLCIWCTGIRVDCSYLKDFKPDPTNTFGKIKVNTYLQMVNYPHFFVGGDLTSINEEKSARKAELHARSIADNLIRMRDNKSLRKYKKGTSPMVISLGDNKGIAQFGRLVVPGFLAGYGKWMVEWWTLRQFK